MIRVARKGGGSMALVVAPAAVLAIFLIDRWLGNGVHALLPTGIVDETAHLLTMALLLGVLPWPLAPRFVAGALVGAVLIDLDHLPLILGSEILTSETNRPFTHGLLIIAGAAGAALFLPPRWRPCALGLAVGLIAHFFRDMATSTAGVPLFWPLSRTGFVIPHDAYFGLLVGCAAVLTWKVPRGTPSVRGPRLAPKSPGRQGPGFSAGRWVAAEKRRGGKLRSGQRRG